MMATTRSFFSSRQEMRRYCFVANPLRRSIWSRTAHIEWKSVAMMNNCYIVAGPDIVFEKFGGDLVVLDIATGRYFGFNPTAARIWEALMAGASPRTSRNWDSMLPRSTDSLKNLWISS